MSAARRGLASLALAGAALAAGGCELAEVTTAPGRDVLAVEAVLRTDETRQLIILHRSLQDGVVRGEPNARVTVLTPEGREVIFRTEEIAACSVFRARPVDAEIEATCYVSAGERTRWVVPGGTYELRVETPDGRMLRGRTTVPGEFGLRAPPLARPGRGNLVVCSLPPDTPFELVWSRAAGTSSYIANLEVFGLSRAFGNVPFRVPDPLKLTGLAVSEADTTLVLPGDFGVFERADLDERLLLALQGGFPAGADVDLTIAAVDRNYLNAVRGGAFNPSGAVRISSVSGDGVGVFASLNPIQLAIRVAPGPLVCGPGRR